MKSQKFLFLVLGVAVLAAVGCSRNKQAAVAPAPVQYAPVSQPVVSAAAPAPVARRSGNYIK